MNYFNLFSNILVTTGAQRISITDLQRNNTELFPLELHDIITGLKTKPIQEVIHSYDTESQQFVKEYIDILLDKEFGFITNGNWDKNFPPLSYEFCIPNEITNAYLILDHLNDLLKIEKSLSNLGTEHLAILYRNSLLLNEFNHIEKVFQNSTITSIEIFSKFEENIDQNFIDRLEPLCARIFNLIFYDCAQPPFKPKDKYKFLVSFVKENIKLNSCGKVDLKYFNTNLPKVLEAVNHNSCLHKKIGVDSNGNIKNCPAMPQTFGNIKDTTLEEALQHKDFKKYWNLQRWHRSL
ncbi:grasp-with-spasm system SPASM domain peptide maturase [Chryseobacterium sp. SN22]|uniref:grasp-with-spasm system SPASM domain peptide maturase n=1 Tax=Chryseobacterium sp. SN22 TaxID=2606431 RepID=UPI001E596F44|nr:grasp-with-spasm system SPASM domain peptide maturase [Chryseobacterium sp. SN22]